MQRHYLRTVHINHFASEDERYGLMSPAYTTHLLVWVLSCDAQDELVYLCDPIVAFSGINVTPANDDEIKVFRSWKLILFGWVKKCKS